MNPNYFVNKASLRLLIMIIAASLLLAACGDEQTTAPVQTSPTTEADHKEVGKGETHQEAPAFIALTPGQIEAAAIGLVQAGPATLRETISLYGVVVPNAERVREVAARFPGAIQSVGKRVGDPVRAGEALATVEANESLQSYTVVSPLAGTVIARNANPGEQTGDKILFTVADLTSVWVEMALFPRDVAKVHVGQNVRVMSSDAGLATEGKVVYVAPFGQAANQTLTARVLLDNPERHWAPGLYVTAEVTLAETAAPLAIHNEAVQTLEGRSVVFVRDDAGFAPREVRLGRGDGEFTEVLSGLAVGDTYVTANSYILKAELGKGSAEHED